ncbi:MAG: biopolymer transporter ExbD [Elusimicrobiota bacterium]
MGGEQQKDDEPITSINITPLVDVSLVLVIIFMAIAPFMIQAGIKVLESKVGTAVGKVSADENVAVRLSRDGTMTVNGAAADALSLSAVIAAALTASKDKMVILTADEDNRVGQVVEVLDAARQAGAQKLAIMRSAKGPEGEKEG